MNERIKAEVTIYRSYLNGVDIIERDLCGRARHVEPFLGAVAAIAIASLAWLPDFGQAWAWGIFALAVLSVIVAVASFYVHDAHLRDATKSLLVALDRLPKQ